MTEKKIQKVKTRLHSRNKNRERYDLSALIKTSPELKKYILLNKYEVESVDFSIPNAVKLLNKAILDHYYGIKNWEFPDENLCPPIPGRADYIHHLADLLAEKNSGEIPIGDKITYLDVGVGASCIYPLIGTTEYGWKAIGSDIDSGSIASAQNIVNSNPPLKDKIELRLQKNPQHIFSGIIHQDEKIDLTICNPPFHASIEDAQKGTRRKIKNLTGKKVNTPKLNFAGIPSELICEGGEYKFIQTMIRESETFAKNCFWFSTLLSKQSNLKGISKLLAQTKASQIKTIPLGTGNKSSRIVVWTFLSQEEQTTWRETRWENKQPHTP
jgi:23S rRNA (adenine1618-N6)-methyltransferase